MLPSDLPLVSPNEIHAMASAGSFDDVLIGVELDESDGVGLPGVDSPALRQSP